MRIFIASNQHQSAIALISKPAERPVAYGSMMHVLLLLLLLMTIFSNTTSKNIEPSSYSRNSIKHEELKLRKKSLIPYYSLLSRHTKVVR
jgi:hypothetical protein